MGGWIAATVAINEPERVSRLMLFDSAGMNFKLSFDPAVFTPQTPEQVDQLMHLVMPDPPKIPRFVKQAIVRKNQRDGWVVQRALASMEAGHDFLEPKFASISAPVLIVWGAVDALTPLSSGEAMHALAPQSVLEVYAGCGHIAVETCSARVAPRVIAFLNDNGPAPGARVDVP
jgi:pimeloyl-ACP methyl ester carboxylesterase